MLVSHSNSSWARLSLAIRRRYARLIAYHVRRAQRWYPDLDESDLEQEIEAAIWMAVRTWNHRRAASMQFSTYLHWHLAKRLGRLRPKAEFRSVPEADRRVRA
jgi:hypothetical protein